MIRTVSRAALFAASACVFASPAFAHMTFEQSSSAPGATFEGVLVLPHGCDGAPSDTVRVTMPGGFAGVLAEAKDGWSLDTVEGDDGEVAEIVWSGGSVPDDGRETFAFSGSFADDLSGDIVFPVIQSCQDIDMGWDPVVSLGGESDEAHDQDHAHGDAISLGDLELSGGFTRATLPNQPVGGGYVTISNTGAEDDRLVGAQSTIAGRVEIHEMAVENDIMTMRELPDGVVVPAGETVALEPGGLHLMLMDLNGPIVEGEPVSVTLTFEHAGSVDLDLVVAAPGARTAPESHGEGHSHAGH